LEGSALPSDCIAEVAEQGLEQAGQAAVQQAVQQRCCTAPVLSRTILTRDSATF